MSDYFRLFLFGIAVLLATMPIFAALDKANDVHEGITLFASFTAMMGVGAMLLGMFYTLATLFGQIA